MAGKTPPSNDVSSGPLQQEDVEFINPLGAYLYSCAPTTYKIKASHSKKFSSVTGPATMPSGGFRVSSKVKMQVRGEIYT